MKKFLVLFAASLFMVSSAVFAGEPATPVIKKVVVPNFARVKAHLSLTEDESEKAYPVMQQMVNQLQIIYNQVDDKTTAINRLNTVLASHKKQMMRILTDDQYALYEPMIESTFNNYIEKIKK